MRTPGLTSDDVEDMVVDSDVTPLPETPQSPPALPLSKTHLEVKGSHEDTFPSRTIEPHWRASSPDSSVPPEVRAPYRHSPHEILRVFKVLDGVLAKEPWLVGGKMTIADLSFAVYGILFL